MPLEDQLVRLVIKALERVDSLSREERERVYEALREELAVSGESGLGAQEAKALLERAISEQEDYWRSQSFSEAQSEQSSIPVENVSSERRLQKLSMSHKFLCMLSRTRHWSKKPPGPPPRDGYAASQKFTESIEAPIIFLGNTYICRIEYSFDAACEMAAKVEELNFNFATRAYSFRHAVEHLGQAFEKRFIKSRIAGLIEGAVWIDKHADCDRVRLDGEEFHALQVLDT